MHAKHHKSKLKFNLADGLSLYSHFSFGVFSVVFGWCWIISVRLISQYIYCICANSSIQFATWIYRHNEQLYRFFRNFEMSETENRKRKIEVETTRRDGKSLATISLHWESCEWRKKNHVFNCRFHEANEIIAQIPFSRVAHAESPIRPIPANGKRYSHTFDCTFHSATRYGAWSAKTKYERTQPERKKNWYEFDGKMISCRLERKWRIFFGFPLSPFALAPGSLCAPFQHSIHLESLNRILL